MVSSPEMCEPKGGRVHHRAAALSEREDWIGKDFRRKVGNNKAVGAWEQCGRRAAGILWRNQRGGWEIHRKLRKGM